ncbi:GspMb/PilO family protein [Roseateles sp.]|uniref:GspMb/PilO family protein n=1 Tax=Roseateles sp. TaxID=1971397 RepID=UPI0025DF3C1C|nr:GspMb/PilO family protein [Roseateles sp.]MBV8033816.1 hypothetical protein [Roseateles sp.]
MSPLLTAWRQAREEWRANARLRIGVVAVVAVLWLWGLLVLQDQAAEWRVETDVAQQELLRIKPLRAATQWTQRADDARKHLEAAQSMVWSASSQGLLEADLQDILRQWCEKAGLPVRELALGAPGESGLPGVSVLRVRLTVDFNRLALMGLLSEINHSPKLMMVESLHIKSQAQPARAELEIKVLFRPEERKP